ncbi:MAG: ClcB-like voltage-gated chloride channel protein [Acidobacteriota bacterium]
MKKGRLSSISRLLKLKDAIHPEENTWFFLLVLAIGFCGGLGAILFRSCSSLLMRFYSGSFELSLLDIAMKLSPVMKILVPAMGGLIAGLVIHLWLKGRKGEGISEIMEALSLKGGSIPLKNVFFKSISSVFLISTGGSVGREGPIVQLGAAFASGIGDFLNVPRDKLRILIGCGVAAGMSAAYNAPIGASFFVMEIIIGNFAMEVFGPLVLSSIVATLVSRTFMGAGPLYAIPHLYMLNPWELLVYALLGLACTLVANLFIVSLPFFERILNVISLPLYIRLAAGGVFLGFMAFTTPQVWGNGYEGVTQILNGEILLRSIASLLLMKILATCITVGSGGSGGIFTPTLFLGACLGGIFGNIMNSYIPEISGPAGGYALAGMGGTIAALTHAPITAILILFEMTQEYDMILPLMLTCAIAGLSSRALKKESFYTEKLSQRGIKLELEFEEIALRSIRVEDIMRKDVRLTPQDAPLEDVMRSFLAGRSNYLYVGDSAGNFIGVIDLHDIKESLAEREPKELVIAWDLAKEVPTVTARDSIADIMEKFWFQEMGHLPVIEGNGSRKFLGIITRRDVIGAFDREILKRKMLLSRYLRRERGEDITSYLSLPEELTIREIPLPASFEGRSLRESDFRGRFHLNILAVKRILDRGEEERLQPEPELILKKNDILVVLGRLRDINKFLSN